MFSKFHIIDWIVIIFTLLFSLVVGLYYGIKHNKSNQDLLLGGRNLQVLPVAASIMVTYVSAITQLGFPAEVYSFGGQIIMLNIVSGIGYIISAFLFVPYFYQMGLTSVNQYLEERFASKFVRRLASFTFILQQLTLVAVILYAPSLVLESFLGFPTWLSIFGVGLCGTFYTSIGGLRAVVWTDLFQTVIMILGMLAIVIKGFSAFGGIAPAIEIARDGGRLNFIDTTVDPFMRHNLWNFLLGTTFYSVMQPAVHQHHIQRYSSMSTLSKAKLVVIYSVPLKLLIMCLCLLTGFSVVAMYSKCDPFLQGEIKNVDQVVPYFIINELAELPGMIGLFTACVFSGVLSSVSSALNSMAAVTWEDFLKDVKFLKSLSESGQANVSRVVGAIYGMIIIGLAFSAENLGAIYAASFAVEGATAGAIYGVFLLGMMFPFVTSKGAVAGLLSGLVSLMYISFMAFYQNRGSSSVRLPTSIEGCKNSTDFTEIRIVEPYMVDIIVEEVWIEKIFQLSYLLYPLVGSCVAIIIGIVFSVVETKVCKNKENSGRISFGKTKQKLLHPLARHLIRRCEKINCLSTST